MHYISIKLIKKSKMLMFHTFGEIFKGFHAVGFDLIIFNSFGLNPGKPLQNVAILTQIVINKL